MQKLNSQIPMSDAINAGETTLNRMTTQGVLKIYKVNGAPCGKGSTKTRYYASSDLPPVGEWEISEVAYISLCRRFEKSKPIRVLAGLLISELAAQDNPADVTVDAYHSRGRYSALLDIARLLDFGPADLAAVVNSLKSDNGNLKTSQMQFDVLESVKVRVSADQLRSSLNYIDDKTGTQDLTESFQGSLSLICIAAEAALNGHLEITIED